MGKNTENDSSLLTLDEWETRKSGSGPQSITIILKMRSLQVARQLQEQFDLEENHVQNDPHMMDPKSIKMSMFSFKRDDT
ncbi:tudor domain-containing protein 3-like [Salvia divinorum]|uniref:Tudor domain-containing protein 3-like n=1 Tax=Salvia divinorum TaxID=28513 RepID=A0ABD1GUW0_SALDI